MDTGCNPWALGAVHGHWVQSMGTGCNPWALGAIHGHWVQSMGTGCSPWALGAIHGHWVQSMGTGCSRCIQGHYRCGVIFFHQASVRAVLVRFQFLSQRGDFHFEVEYFVCLLVQGLNMWKNRVKTGKMRLNTKDFFKKILKNKKFKESK